VRIRARKAIVVKTRRVTGFEIDECPRKTGRAPGDRLAYLQPSLSRIGLQLDRLEMEEPNLLVNWEKYIAPAFAKMLPFDGRTFMYIVGVIEIS
jgi:hypothetical protein